MYQHIYMLNNIDIGSLNILSCWQNGWYSSDNIFSCIFLNENCKIQIKFYSNIFRSF